MNKQIRIFIQVDSSTSNIFEAMVSNFGLIT